MSSAREQIEQEAGMKYDGQAYGFLLTAERVIERQSAEIERLKVRRLDEMRGAETLARAEAAEQRSRVDHEKKVMLENDLATAWQEIERLKSNIKIMQEEYLGPIEKERDQLRGEVTIKVEAIHRLIEERDAEIARRKRSNAARDDLRDTIIDLKAERYQLRERVRQLQAKLSTMTDSYGGEMLGNCKLCGSRDERDRLDIAFHAAKALPTTSEATPGFILFSYPEDAVALENAVASLAAIDAQLAQKEKP